ncbi:hypothetical protein K1X76_06335 [bacterium]|nr:hypothetical protein [bacterium]
MKNLILILLVLLASVAQPVLSQASSSIHEENCKCGEDEDGECKPC